MNRDDLGSVRGLLTDMDGVWFVGRAPIPGAAEALARLRARSIPIRFITNTTTRTADQLAEKMRGMGLDTRVDEFVTTPWAAARYLKERGIRSVRLAVADSVKSVFAEFEESDSPEAVVIGDVGDAWTYALMNGLFRAVMDGAEIVALHKGRYWQVEEGLRMDIGAFVAGLEFATGQRATVIGKPSAAMFDAALRGLQLAKDDVVMIGDDIRHDVGGAQAAGIRGVLVKTGKFRAERDLRAGIRPDLILDSIAELP
jgi:HAD superfamily hydrolase (TIGR01458 family)